MTADDMRFTPKPHATDAYAVRVYAVTARDDGETLFDVYKTSAGAWRATGAYGVYATRRDAATAAWEQRYGRGA